MGVDRNDPEVEKLVRSPLPVIAVDIDVVGDHTSYVASDNIGGARLAVRHLHSLGHTRIATIAGPARRSRLPTARSATAPRCGELGLEILPGYECRGRLLPGEREQAMESMLALKEPPTAVFAAADMMAVGAIRTVQAAGLSVPATSPSSVSTTSASPTSFPAADHDSTGHGRHRLAAGRALVEQIENPERPASADAAGRTGRPGFMRLGRKRRDTR